VRAADRPQSIATWRPMFAGAALPQATVVMRSPIKSEGTSQPRPDAKGAAKSAKSPVVIAGLALSLVAAVAAAWFLVGPRPMTPVAPPAPTAADNTAAAAAEELNRLRAEAEARRKADEEAALRRRIEDEVRQKAEAEQAARQKAEEEQRRAAAEAAQAEAAKAEAAKAEAAKAEAAKAEAQKKVPPPAPAPPSTQAAASSATGANQCDGSFRAQWCRGAFQGFPQSCWSSPATIRNGVISGQWTSQGATEPQTFNGTVAANGTVSIVYNGIGQQTFTGRHFSAVMTGSVTGGVLNAKGRAGDNGRDFSVTIQCK